jgi:hypothetical protein
VKVDGNGAMCNESEEKTHNLGQSYTFRERLIFQIMNVSCGHK